MLDRAASDSFLKLEPIARTESLSTLVKNSLAELIIQRAFPPGHHIVETEVANQLGVSRQPVREALLHLSAHGWVDQIPGRGTFVHEPTRSEITDAMKFRVLMETEAARLAADLGTPKDFAELAALAKAGLSAVETGDMATAIKSDSDFHAKVASLSGNSYLRESLDRLSLRSRWYLRPVLEMQGDRSFSEHLEIAELMSRGDGAAAADRMRAHTEEAIELVFATTEPAGT